MVERTRRIGKNEAVCRSVNEQIESLNRATAALGDPTMHIVCECGDIHCIRHLVVAIPAYERIRSEPACFFVAPGHELSDVEDVVERGEGYNVVRKRDGGPARLAEATDPRD